MKISYADAVSTLALLLAFCSFAYSVWRDRESVRRDNEIRRAAAERDKPRATVCCIRRHAPLGEPVIRVANVGLVSFSVSSVGFSRGGRELPVPTLPRLIEPGGVHDFPFHCSIPPGKAFVRLAQGDLFCEV